MSMIGDLNVIQGNIEVEWQIKNFFSLITNENENYTFSSSNFNFADETWYLEMDVFGKTENGQEGYIGFYLMPVNITAPVTLTYNLILKKANGTIEKECNYTHTFTDNINGNGCPKILKTSEFLSRMSDFAPTGILTLSCSLQETRKTISRKLCTRNERKLIEDIKELMLKQYNSDLKVRIRDEEFNLHKSILRVRTPSFAALIDDNLKQLSTDVVELDGFDENTFRLFLDYVYSGTIDDLSGSNVFNLYEFTEKYEIIELKEDCLAYIKENLTVGTFFDTYYLADKHDIKELLILASEFCTNNLKELMKNREWINFMRDSPAKAYEMLTTAFDNFEKKDE